MFLFVFLEENNGSLLITWLELYLIEWSLTGTASGTLAEKAEGHIEASEDEIAFEGAQVVTPANATLVQDLNLR